MSLIGASRVLAICVALSAADARAEILGGPTGSIAPSAWGAGLWSGYVIGDYYVGAAAAAESYTSSSYPHSFTYQVLGGAHVRLTRRIRIAGDFGPGLTHRIGDFIPSGDPALDPSKLSVSVTGRMFVAFELGEVRCTHISLALLGEARVAFYDDMGGGAGIAVLLAR